MTITHYQIPNKGVSPLDRRRLTLKSNFVPSAKSLKNSQRLYQNIKIDKIKCIEKKP